MYKLKIIGAGLAGCEAAYQAAKRGIDVTLVESKPTQKSPAHKMDTFAELVCSNSLKSNELTSASGLLKKELRLLDSFILSCADSCTVPAGSALAVDREAFSRLVTERISQFDNITVQNRVETDIMPADDEVVVVATGPLTNSALLPSISKFCGEFLHFFDAVAPIVTDESIDYDSAFVASRYDKGSADYVNCPMNKEEFTLFWQELVNAKTVTLHDFEIKVFEGCMPIETMAKRGIDTIRYGMFKPMGLFDQRANKRPYAVLQLRKENSQGSLYNLVGCQTNLTFGEQKRVFSLIPALKNAEFIRYGVMHRNIYVNSPDILTPTFATRQNPRLFFAGQITGVEGYVESIGSGLLAGINAAATILDRNLTTLPSCSIMGGLAEYICTHNENFQPMNANFGILPPLGPIIRDKNEKKAALCNRSVTAIELLLKQSKGE